MILLLDKKVKPMICTDKERLQGILINLLSLIIAQLRMEELIIQIKHFKKD